MTVLRLDLTQISTIRGRLHPLLETVGRMMRTGQTRAETDLSMR